MKYKAALVTVFLLFIIFNVKVKADPADAYRISGADKLETNEYVSEEEKSGKTKVNISQKLLNIVTAGLSSNIKGALKAFGIMAGLLTISSVLKNTAFVTESKTLSGACDLISGAVISLSLFSLAKNLFDYVISSLDAVNTYTKALLPVTATLYSLSGCVDSAVSASASSYLFLSFTEILTNELLLPFLNVGFAFILVSVLPGTVDLSPVCSMIKKSVSFALAFIFTCFGFVISVKSIMAQSADRLAFRGLKFASGTFIPIIGNVLGDSARTVFASVNVIKSTVGAAGMISIMALTIPPLIAVFLYRISLSVCSALSKALSLERESKMLDGANELLGILSAVVAGCSVVFIIICGIFMRSGVDL